MKNLTRIYLKTFLGKTFLGLTLAVSLTGCNPAGEPIASSNANNNANSAKAAPAICNDCGTITNIETVKEKGSGSGLGAVIGAVAGGVIGHQVGDGRGNDAATATGAIGGGIAGHQVEKRINGVTHYRVTVAMENGSTRVADVDALNGLSTGSKVKVVGNNLHVAS